MYGTGVRKTFGSSLPKSAGIEFYVKVNHKMQTFPTLKSSANSDAERS